MKRLLLFAACVLCLSITGRSAEPEPIAAPKAEDFGRGFKMPPKEVIEAKHAEAAKRHGRRMANLPKVTAPTWDCRTLGIVPPVLSQGNCGSCYIFSACGPATSANIKAGKGKADGSFRIQEQAALDCYRNLGGCGGGWPAEVMEVLKTKGLPLESEYGPYTARSGTCKNYSKVVKIDDWGYCTPGQESGQSSVQDMKNAIVKYGPISVALDSSGLSSGSDDRVDTCSGNNIDHAVVIIGWDDNKGTSGAWLMRNSWGNWANGGYRWVSFKSNIVESIWAHVDGEPVPPTPPDPVPPGPGPTPQPDSIVVTGGDVVVVTEVSSFPFTLTVSSNGLGYVWEVPEGVKYKRKNNAIEISAAPKGMLSISVEYSVVDFKAGTIIPKFAEKKLRVGEAPKKPQTRLQRWEPACCGIAPDFQFAGLRLMVVQP